MSPDLDRGVVGRRLGCLRIDAGKASKKGDAKSPIKIAPVVAVAKLPTPPFSPVLPADDATVPPLLGVTLPATPDALTTPSTEESVLFLEPPAVPNGTTIVPATTFPLFPLLPAELRLKIWAFSFVPRTVELHARRTHYANDDHGDTPRWRSHSLNPPALSVNPEARAAALEHYIAFPLAGLPVRGVRDVALTGLQTCERPGDMLRDGDRKLYINVAEDTVVLFSDMNFLRVKRLLDWFRTHDVGRKGREGARGLRKLAMSVMAWSIAVGAAETLSWFGRTVFADIDEFYFFMFEDWIPPEAWTGARCELVDVCPEHDYYRRFVMGRGQQFRDRGGWMKVGKRPLKVVEIRFYNEGW